MTDAPGASDVTVNTRYAMKRYRTGYNTGHAEGYQAGYLEGIKVNSAQTAELSARVADTTVQLSNQYQRIERFVELVNQLEAQLAQRWEPLPVTEIVQHLGEWPVIPAEYANDQIALCRLVAQEPTP